MINLKMKIGYTERNLFCFEDMLYDEEAEDVGMKVTREGDDLVISMTILHENASLKSVIDFIGAWVTDYHNELDGSFNFIEVVNK